MSLAKMNGSFTPTSAQLATIKALTVGNATPNELRVILTECSRKVENPSGAALGSEPNITTVVTGGIFG